MSSYSSSIDLALSTLSTLDIVFFAYMFIIAYFAPPHEPIQLDTAGDASSVFLPEYFGSDDDDDWSEDDEFESSGYIVIRGSEDHRKPSCLKKPGRTSVPRQVTFRTVTGRPDVDIVQMSAGRDWRHSISGSYTAHVFGGTWQSEDSTEFYKQVDQFDPPANKPVMFRPLCLNLRPDEGDFRYCLDCHRYRDHRQPNDWLGDVGTFVHTFNPMKPFTLTCPSAPVKSCTRSSSLSSFAKPPSPDKSPRPPNWPPNFPYFT